jgi:transposase-like protein
MGHRIREIMREGNLSPFGVNGGIVESDETFIWDDPDIPKRHGYAHKNKVLSLLDRSTGCTRSMVIESLKGKDIIPILKENIDHEARIMTDDAGQYTYLKNHFSRHDVVRHSTGEYVSMKDRAIHTNTIEGYFSIFKRGVKGIYQHCKKHHLHRYLAEFDYRYNMRSKKGIDDVTRAEILLKGVTGKRLTYQTTN